MGAAARPAYSGLAPPRAFLLAPGPPGARPRERPRPHAGEDVWPEDRTVYTERSDLTAIALWSNTRTRATSLWRW